MWQILRFEVGDVVGKVFGTGFTEATAREYIDILDKKFDGTGIIFFAEKIEN